MPDGSTVSPTPSETRGLTVLQRWKVAGPALGWFRHVAKLPKPEWSCRKIGFHCDILQAQCGPRQRELIRAALKSNLITSEMEVLG